ncbi:uncharacterized protein LOC110049231 [Orbicella faveolata]|uniref:uncharacterized protein LOC110049231 n=1 Tax=Orbicella faveolata TaxID=48498 RepID=UPI0009E65531|nr:uncharacterized protein LOC110049231 [Orbicella faveolata]
MASRPPSRLQKTENAPTLTTEALQQKQAAAEKDRQKKLDKKIEALKSKKQCLKELPTPRETYNAWQRKADLKGKRPSSERLKEKSQAEIIAKQRPREEKAKISHDKAKQIQDGDDAVDFAVDHDQAHSADEESMYCVIKKCIGPSFNSAFIMSCSWTRN